MNCLANPPVVIGCADPAKTKKVRIRLSVDLETTVPLDWTEGDILFYFNESSHCLGSEIDQLYAEANAEDHVCNICDRAKVELLPEAKSQEPGAAS